LLQDLEFTLDIKWQHNKVLRRFMSKQNVLKIKHQNAAKSESVAYFSKYTVY